MLLSIFHIKLYIILQFHSTFSNVFTGAGSTAAGASGGSAPGAGESGSKSDEAMVATGSGNGGSH